MRLDVFLPVIKKPKRDEPAQEESWFVRLWRPVLPAALFDDLATGKAGLARSWLKWLGPSWVAAPWRRIIQGVCFVAFCVLFFYVLYPYTAQPPATWRSWQPQAVAAGEGGPAITLVREGGEVAGLWAGKPLHAGEQSAADPAKGYFGPVAVVSAEPGKIVVRPGEGFLAAKLEELQFSLGGPWMLAELAPGEWPAHYADSLAAKEPGQAEIFLILDPLVAISTSIASRTWAWSLLFAGIILAIGVLVPRGFCGYLCPLGTLIDLFDWSVTKRVTALNVPDEGWWVHIKYYVLLGTLVCSLCGVLVTGFVAAIPVITRGFLMLFDPLQTGLTRGWHQIPPPNAGHIVSLVLFFAVLGLGFLRARFWCKYVCPSGAVFSVFNVFRATERKVEDTCIHCNKCVEICPFDAIKPDFTTRVTDCTLCQTCGGVCPVHAIKFVDRWDQDDLKPENEPPTDETPLGRRGWMSLAAGVTLGVAGAAGLTTATHAWGANLPPPGEKEGWLPVRPPGSVPEQEFLQLCIRCGECFKACPNNVLQPMGFEQGLEGLWTPQVVADWAGCESSCNACGQVCPTGAIRALPLAEKKAARMGLAVVNQQTCLPIAGREACQLCVDECHHAGYHAIEFIRVGTKVDELGLPIEDSGFLAPQVLADKCVGCGLCQTRCYGINVAEKGLLGESAIIIHAGDGREDRLHGGSYQQLRREEAEKKKKEQQPTGGDYLPDFLK